MSNHNIRVDAIGLAAEVVELRNEIARLKNQTNWVCKCGGTDCKGQKENAELNATLDAIIAADERAVKLWRAAHPGNELVIPDRGKLVEWLLEQNAALRELVGTLGASNHINVPIEQWRELRKDKERLDWLQSDCSCDLSWAGKEAPPSALTSLRNAIDWTRKEAQP